MKILRLSSAFIGTLQSAVQVVKRSEKGLRGSVCLMKFITKRNKCLK